jgi:hypothetical protein
MKSSYQVKQVKEEGSHSSSSAKVKAKKSLNQFPQTNPKSLPYPMLPAGQWKGVRHMTEGRLRESSSEPERS